MKLKKLLSGVTAAIMVLSSVAITSFTSASAADKIFAKILSNQTTVLAQGTADESLAGATKARFTYQMGPNANWANYTYLILQLRVGYSEFTQKLPGVEGAVNGASGVVTVDLPAEVKEDNAYIIQGSTTFGGATGEFNYAFGFSKIEFLNDSEEVLKTHTEVGALPEIDPYPGDVLPIRMMDNQSDLCKPLVIEGDGQYTMEAKNINIGSGDNYSSFGLYNGYAAQVLDPDVTITLDSLVLNGNVSIDITDDWRNRSALDSGTLSFLPVNNWHGDKPGTPLNSKIPSSVTSITSIKMVFTIKNTGLSKDNPVVQPAQIIDSITYNFTVTEPGISTQIKWTGMVVGQRNGNYTGQFGGDENATAIIEPGKTDYSVRIGDLYCNAVKNLGFASGSGNETKIKVTTVVINDRYTFTLNKELILDGNNNGLANVWNADGWGAVVPYECENAYLAGSPLEAVGIRLYAGPAPGSTIDPADGLNIKLADNAGTQLGDKAVKIEKDGSYELSAEGLKLEVGNCSAGLSAKKANQLIAADSKITLTKLVVNGQEYDITDAWKNISPFDESGNLSVFPINFWNEEEAIIKKGDKLKDGASTISSITIAFDLSATGLSGGQQPGPGDDPKPPIDPPAPTSYEAFLMYADAGYNNWNTQKHPETKGTTAAVTGSGTYTVGVGPEMANTVGNTTASGIEVMCVDIVGYGDAINADTREEGDIPEADARAIAKKAGLNITNVSIIADGKEVYKYADKDVMFGDIERNGNIRIDIYNKYNESGKEDHENDYDAPQKVQDLADGELEASENIQVKFTISYNKGGNNNSGGTNVKPGKPNNPTVDKKPAANNTAKKNAENAMKKATIKKLKVNAKKAKKVTVTWNNIKKVKGYKIKGYEVQVSNKSGFGNKLLKKTVKKSKIVIKTNKKIKRGKKYFVRVRAYTTYKDAKGKTQKACGKWKKSAKFKIK